MEDTIDYKPFFGLLEEPFNTVASPRFFYLSPIHAIALNKSVFTVDYNVPRKLDSPLR